MSTGKTPVVPVQMLFARNSVFIVKPRENYGIIHYVFGAHRIAVALPLLLPILAVVGESLPFRNLDDIRGPYTGTGANGEALYICELGDAGHWPIRAYWTSAADVRSPVFGRGWRIPALEATFVQLDERRWAFNQPDGFVRIFIKTPRMAPNTLSGGEAWSAVVQKDSVQVTADPHDGGPKSRFSFQQGRLTHMVCEEGDFEIKYDGRAASKIVSKGKVLLEVVRKPGADEQSVTLRFAGGGQVVATCRPFAAPPSADKTAANAADATVPPTEMRLASLKLQNGKTVAFEYGGDAYSAFFKANGSKWTWHVGTGKIASHDEWTYVVEDGDGGGAHLTRHHSDGRRELNFYDAKSGRHVRQMEDGSRFESQTFTSGPLAGRRTRWTKTTRADGSFTRTDFAYDETGRMVFRKIRGYGGSTEETWFAEDGKIARQRVDGVEVETK